MASNKTWTCDGQPKNKKYKGQGKKHSPITNNVGRRCIEPGCGLPQDAVQNDQAGNKGLVIVLAFMGIVFLGAGSVFALRFLPIPNPVSSCLKLQPKQEETRFSSGEKILFTQETTNRYLNDGISEFKNENYKEAGQKPDPNDPQKLIPGYFAQAMQAVPNNPEPRIYFNNAKARDTGCPYRVAIAVPIDGRADVAKEILRGAADAQNDFNIQQESEGKKRLLEIVIVKDGNDDKAVTTSIAEDIVNDPAILGVIGHNSSEASKIALEIYQSEGDESQKIAMISPTSTATSLQGDVFFRTVPDDSQTAETMANHLKNLAAKKIVIFYEAGSNYSESLKIALENKLKNSDTNIYKTVDISPPDFNISTIIEDSISDEVDTIIVLPSTGTTANANQIIKTIREKENTTKKINILGDDALYNPDTLSLADNALEGLVVVAPIVPSESYQNEALENWKGFISWRTVAAYDATTAIAQAINKESEPTRKTIIENLPATSVASKASEEFQFVNGERRSEPILVVTDPKAPKPPGAKFGFKRLEN
jgi:branched-chain amino acid transport system substrate-binding protein